MSPLEQCAVDYVVARRRNDEAEPKDWMLRRAELDAAWHQLCVAVDGPYLFEPGLDELERSETLLASLQE